MIHYIRGPAGLQPTSVAVTGSNISWTYNITVPAGQTVTLAYFTIAKFDPSRSDCRGQRPGYPRRLWRPGGRFP